MSPVCVCVCVQLAVSAAQSIGCVIGSITAGDIESGNANKALDLVWQVCVFTYASCVFVCVCVSLHMLLVYLCGCVGVFVSLHLFLVCVCVCVFTNATCVCVCGCLYILYWCMCVSLLMLLVGVWVGVLGCVCTVNCVCIAASMLLWVCMCYVCVCLCVGGGVCVGVCYVLRVDVVCAPCIVRACVGIALIGCFLYLLYSSICMNTHIRAYPHLFHICYHILTCVRAHICLMCAGYEG